MHNRTSLQRNDLLIAAGVWILAFALYVRTLAPSLLWGDSAEFQTLAYTLGMTHPSGYMTHILIGKLFTFIPFGNIAWRVNLMSAFFAALAVAQVYLIGRLLNGRRAAALASSALLALAQGFWWRALIAESYATAAGFIASIWLLILLWERTHKWGFLFAAGILGGLSLGIHSTIVMTAVSVLIVMVTSARTKSAWTAAALGALLGATCTLAAFLYVDTNDPPSSIYNTVYRPSLSEFGLTESQFDTPFERLAAIFPADSFWTYYFSAAPEEIHARLVEFVSFLPAWAFVLILLGMLVLFQRAGWRDALYPLAGFLLVWGLAVTVAFSIFREFYVPAMVFLAVWMGAGASAFLDGLEWLLKRIPATGRVMRTLLVGASSLTLVLLPFLDARADLQSSILRGYPEFVRRDHIYPIFAPDKAIQDARKILGRLEPNAILFTDWDKLYSLAYTAEVENAREDVSIHSAFVNEKMRVADSALAYIDANIDERPIYFTVLSPELSENYQIEDLGGSLYRLRRK
ncbi:MAG: protein O-mannosyl-transferase family [Chloroflexota bacterium]